MHVAERHIRRPHILDPDSLSKYIDTLYRAAWALCGSKHNAEDLVQETLVNVLKRPRLLRDDNELGYLLRALRNTYSSRYRSQAQRPVEHRLFEHDVSYHEAARALRTREATITTRLHRGRQHVAQVLLAEPVSAS